MNLNFLAFLMDIEVEPNRLSEILSQIPDAIEKAKNFQCSECNHSIDSPWPPLPTFDDPEFLESDLLFSDDHDSFFELNTSTPGLFQMTDDESEDDESDCESLEFFPNSAPQRNSLPCLVSLSTSLPSSLRFAGPYLDSQNKSMGETTLNVLDSLEDNCAEKAQLVFVCFFSRRNFMEDSLGVDVSVRYINTTNIIMSINSSIDFLSKTSFYEENVRRSVMNESFDHWIPLCNSFFFIIPIFFTMLTILLIG